MTEAEQFLENPDERLEERRQSAIEAGQANQSTAVAVLEFSDGSRIELVSVRGNEPMIEIYTSDILEDPGG